MCDVQRDTINKQMLWKLVSFIWQNKIGRYRLITVRGSWNGSLETKAFFPVVSSSWWRNTAELNIYSSSPFCCVRFSGEPEKCPARAFVIAFFRWLLPKIWVSNWPVFYKSQQTLRRSTLENMLGGQLSDKILHCCIKSNRRWQHHMIYSSRVIRLCISGLLWWRSISGDVVIEITHIKSTYPVICPISIQTYDVLCSL